MQDKASQHWDLAAAGPDRAFSEKVARHSNSRGCTEKGELVASNLIRREFAVAAAEDFSMRAERHDGLGRSWSWFYVVQIDSAALSGATSLGVWATSPPQNPYHYPASLHRPVAHLHRVHG